MSWGILFFANSLLLGAGLAMDAFSVSLANGLNEPFMRKRRMLMISGVYAAFQFLMPMTGWFLVHTAVGLFSFLEPLIPWIALILLLYIGGKMVWEGFHGKGEELCRQQGSEKCKNCPDRGVRCHTLTRSALLLQGIATSIDALSVGFTTAEFGALQAFVSSLIIGGLTWVICFVGLNIGKKAGVKLADKATIVGGVILILIGIEIFLSNMFG